VRSTVIDDAMNGRNMHYTAMNAPVISSTAAANAAMAEIGQFSRSNDNNKECMQFGDDVCMSNTVSARVHEVVQRDTFDLTDLFCRVQACRTQQAQHSQQLYTLVDEIYATAGQRQHSSPQPTQQTQASTSQQAYTSQPLQPTQQVDLFQQELMAMADAAMQQRHALPASPALALTDVHLAVPPPATAEASHLALTSTPVAAHHSAPRQLDTTVPMQPGQRCGPHLPRSKRPASDDSYNDWIRQLASADACSIRLIHVLYSRLRPFGLLLRLGHVCQRLNQWSAGTLIDILRLTVVIERWLAIVQYQCQ